MISTLIIPRRYGKTETLRHYAVKAIANGKTVIYKGTCQRTCDGFKDMVPGVSTNMYDLKDGCVLLIDDIDHQDVDNLLRGVKPCMIYTTQSTHDFICVISPEGEIQKIKVVL